MTAINFSVDTGAAANIMLHVTFHNTIHGQMPSQSDTHFCMYGDMFVPYDFC